LEDPLHREILEEHARSPGHQISLGKSPVQTVWTSLKTGNTCSISISIKDNRLAGIQATVNGSALAVACASLMGQAAEDLAVGEAIALAESVIEFLEYGKETTFPGDLIVYESIIRFPERHDCAMLAWRALVSLLKN
jgi:NifU-like protein involved in Fe-S cluster formation